MSPQVFTIMAALIEERIGLHYSVSERELLGYKLSSRAVESGFYSLLDYYYHLRYDDPDGVELAALTDALVVNETFFFRERAPLEQVVEAYVVPLCARKRKPRIWCAAAATGEEPFSLACLLAERGLRDQVELIATDISQRALARARSGVHARRSIREGCPADLVAKYLYPSGDRIHVIPAIRDMVQFQYLNLLDHGCDREARALRRDSVPQCSYLFSQRAGAAGGSARVRGVKAGRSAPGRRIRVPVAPGHHPGV